jgi:hypothetical protein
MSFYQGMTEHSECAHEVGSSPELMAIRLGTKMLNSKLVPYPFLAPFLAAASSQLAKEERQPPAKGDKNQFAPGQTYPMKRVGFPHLPPLPLRFIFSIFDPQISQICSASNHRPFITFQFLLFIYIHSASHLSCFAAPSNPFYVRSTDVL